MDGVEKGIVLELSDDLAEALRKGQVGGKKNTARDGSERSSSIRDEWDILIRGGDTHTQNETSDEILAGEKDRSVSSEHAKYNESSGENEADDRSEATSLDDTASTCTPTPPATMPLVLVDTERLVGWKPSTQEQARDLREQVHDALCAANSSVFDESRLSDLFDNGIARHADSSTVTIGQDLETNGCLCDFQFIAIHYPASIADSDPEQDNQLVNERNATARVWKRLLKLHDISVANRLFEHLRNCSRPLSWKREMRQELECLVREEHRTFVQSQYAVELNHWKRGGRKERLEKLYDVREVFEHRIREAELRRDQQVQAREVLVQKEIQRQRLLAGSSVMGLEAFDLETTLFSFPDQTNFNMLSLRDDALPLVGEDDEEEALMSDYDVESIQSTASSDFSKHSHEQDGEEAHRNESKRSEDVPDHASKLDARRRKRDARRVQQRRLRETAREEAEKAKLEEARALEENIRQSSPLTHQVNSAIAIVESLKDRLQRVDDLLERLQEEEWAQEENEEVLDVRDANVALSKDCDDITDRNEFSLLDDVLAMILGAIPPPLSAKDDSTKDPNTCIANHVRWLEKEHHDITREWKAQFGRLPPRASGPNTSDRTQVSQRNGHEIVDQATLRKSFGIEENVLDDWEEESVEEATKPRVKAETVTAAVDPPTASLQKSTPAITKKHTVGLRPGGRVG